MTVRRAGSWFWAILSLSWIAYAFNTYIEIHYRLFQQTGIDWPDLPRLAIIFFGPPIVLGALMLGTHRLMLKLRSRPRPAP